MRYNDRVKIIFNQNVTNDGWDDEVKAVTSDWLACKITGVQSDMNMGIFGKYVSGAREIHFKNKVPNMDYVLIDDNIKRKPAAIKQARQNTVVIIGAV